MSRRQSIEERARRDNDAKPDSSDESNQQAAAQKNGQRLSKKQRRAARAAQRAKERQGTVDAPASEVAETGNAASRPSASRNGKGIDADSASGVPTRPNRRRETEEEPADEEKFPWHFQFDDDEPDQLQASSPLLSRAFRATIG